ARQFLADELEAINAAAVRIAREAREVAGRDVFIAGSVGPLGDYELAGHDPVHLYAEQAQILEGRGVDLFMVETFYDLDELETAIGAVRSVSSLPVVALLTFDAGGETLAGVKAEDAAAGRRRPRSPRSATQWTPTAGRPAPSSSRSASRWCRSSRRPERPSYRGCCARASSRSRCRSTRRSGPIPRR